ncbi:MAG: LVIVD repeat-containing protein, partial [Wenzhouxiangellaceae bacterium]
WGLEVERHMRAHSDEEMECYACHTSWTTSCGGCHLPIEANWKTDRLHYEGGATRNYSTYNPQVARDQTFMLARQGEQQGGKYAPARSSSALVLSSTDSFRQKIYVQQPPISSSGFSSQAMNTHFPHTVRKTETRVCSDCHLSKGNDNNAIVAQTLMLGTNFLDFLGYYAWVGGDGELSAVQVTEWQEPQAVIGSYLHRYAYPDWHAAHLDRARTLETAHRHAAGRLGCIQHRGEYLYTAGGKDGFRVFDIASVANKGFSQRIVSAPFSPLGQDMHVATTDATCLDLVTTQPIHPDRNQGERMRVDNQEQPFAPIYDYAVITDSVEGLILVDVNTLADSDPRNNHLERALTWNDDGLLDGARHVTMAGNHAYVTADRGIVTLDLSEPLSPRVISVIPLTGARASTLQFRYLFVVDGSGLSVVDVTDPARPKRVEGSAIALEHAHNVYVSRTYAYVAAGRDGLVIVDVSNPESMALVDRFTADGAIEDARDVVVASTNASLFAYVADGSGGLKVVQLTSPEAQPKFYGFSPLPKPELIASYSTGKPALSLSRPLERDRGVDETGGQVAVFGRKGARPLTGEEMRNLYLDSEGQPWFVSDEQDDE